MTFYRRNLPHWQPDDKSIFLTWRLFGSLPRSTVRLTLANLTDAGQQFRELDRYLDSATSGPSWLADARVADAVESIILRGVDLGHYAVWAYVIMLNHVHILVQPRVLLSQITHGVKGVSARDANLILGRVGKPFWQDESFDHWARNASEAERIRRYMERNPVQAGLVASPELWKWSSAGKQVIQDAQPRVAVPPSRV